MESDFQIAQFFFFHLPMKLMEMWRAALFGTEQQDSAANICS